MPLTSADAVSEYCATPDAVRQERTRNGFDPVFGERPLRRLVQSAIGDKLARALLSGTITDGDEILVDLDEAADELTVRPAVKAS